MAFLSKDRIFSRKWIIDYLLIISGSLILATGFVYFVTPHRIVPGGVYGIAIVVHYMSQGIFSFWPDGIPIGLFGLILNIPLTIAGIRILGPRFGIKTIVGFVLTSVFIDGITYLRPDGNTPLVDDILLSCVFGGVLIGFGLGLIFKSRATSGGSDIIAMIIAKYTRLQLGKLMIYVDSTIVLLGLLAFRDWHIPLYSWVVIYITGRAIDMTLEGADYNKALLIISKKHIQIKNKLLVDLERGGTYLRGEGMFTGEEKQIIYTVVSRREVAILEEYISKIDPDAFITVMDTKEILGEGFQSLNSKMDS
ncbi:YitT family protein [Maribellus maritimus]|uniref:YitT family protein n=1 Tax=Maribellus maritimus TaxID=2870838 RepID=UPI001EE9D0C9|nr:YitT family protein [Maribellus maritimus]MCG6188115.1 YitT family protein [Maribellus maritimus]